MTTINEFTITGFTGTPSEFSATFKVGTLKDLGITDGLVGEDKSKVFAFTVEKRYTDEARHKKFGSFTHAHLACPNMEVAMFEAFAKANTFITCHHTMEHTMSSLRQGGKLSMKPRGW